MPLFDLHFITLHYIEMVEFVVKPVERFSLEGANWDKLHLRISIHLFYLSVRFECPFHITLNKGMIVSMGFVCILIAKLQKLLFLTQIVSLSPGGTPCSRHYDCPVTPDEVFSSRGSRRPATATSIFCSALLPVLVKLLLLLCLLVDAYESM